MNDNNQDRSQTEGQQGLDRETEQRNRENETGQAQGQAPSSEDRESELGQQNPAGTEGGGFVGSGKEDSSDYVTTGEQNPDFAAQGQGAQDSSAGSSDIETGQPAERESEIDDGSDSNR